MGIFNKIFGNKESKNNNEQKNASAIQVDDNYFSLMRKYTRQFLPNDVDTIESQKTMLSLVSRVIPSVNVDTMSLQLQRIFETNDLNDMNILQFQGRLALEIDKWLSVTNADKITSDFSSFKNEELLSAWGTLDFYTYVLKEEYSENIRKFVILIAKELKFRGIAFEEVQISKFEQLQQKCAELSKENPESAELAVIKKDLFNELLQLQSIWFAYDEDFGKGLFIGLTGRMEIFTKEAYAIKAKEHFSKFEEGNFSIHRIDNNNIKSFFEDVLYQGGMLFNLDNGIANVEMKIEDYIPYTDNVKLDRNNRAIRCYLLRHLQGICRFQKFTNPDPQKKQMYQTILNTLISNGFTALANGTLYVLTGGPYVENITFYSKKAYDKVKRKIQSNGYVDESLMIADGDLRHGTMDNIPGIETMQYPNKGRFAAIFTDKKGADTIREEFKKFGSEYDLNIVAMNFDEILPLALPCDGIIVDPHSFGYIINKEQMEFLHLQIFKEEV